MALTRLLTAAYTTPVEAPRQIRGPRHGHHVHKKALKLALCSHWRRKGHHIRDSSGSKQLAAVAEQKLFIVILRRSVFRSSIFAFDEKCRRKMRDCLFGDCRAKESDLSASERAERKLDIIHPPCGWSNGSDSNCRLPSEIRDLGRRHYFSCAAASSCIIINI